MHGSNPIYISLDDLVIVLDESIFDFGSRNDEKRPAVAAFGDLASTERSHVVLMGFLL